MKRRSRKRTGFDLAPANSHASLEFGHFWEKCVGSRRMFETSVASASRRSPNRVAARFPQFLTIVGRTLQLGRLAKSLKMHRSLQISGSTAFVCLCGAQSTDSSPTHAHGNCGELLTLCTASSVSFRAGARSSSEALASIAADAGMAGFVGGGGLVMASGHTIGRGSQYGDRRVSAA